jgi:hypothetical protein
MEINLDLNEYSNSNFKNRNETKDAEIRMRNIRQNFHGDLKYNIPEIISKIKILSGKEIINEVSKLLKEKKVN